MKVIRQEQDYQLNIGNGMAKGLYNITDQANDNTKMRVSNWLHKETKDFLMSLSTEEFIEECENLLV